MKKIDSGAVDAALAELFLVSRTGSASRSDWTVKTRVPFVPHLSMLSTLSVTVLNFYKQVFIQRFSEEHVIALRGRLWWINDRASTIWMEAMKDPETAIQNPTLADNGPLRSRVAGLERLCRGQSGHQFEGALLSDYTDNVQDSLAGFTRHMTKMLAASNTTGDGAKDGPESVQMKASTKALGELAGGLLGRCASDDELLLAGGMAAVGAIRLDERTSAPQPDWIETLKKNFGALSRCLPQ